jgi:CubicO group peptidase (beta-lactamase class C family)
MNDLVIKYIPELKNAAAIAGVDSTPWEDITVDSLMTQLSGISTDSKRALTLICFI